MTDDTRERFLREITAQVPADRIAELHLFRPLRRGGTETGVAVIAVEQDDPSENPATVSGGDEDTDAHLATLSGGNEDTDTQLPAPPGGDADTDADLAALQDGDADTDAQEPGAGVEPDAGPLIELAVSTLDHHSAVDDPLAQGPSASRSLADVDDDNPYADDVGPRSPNAEVEVAAAPVAHADAGEEGDDESSAADDVSEIPPRERHQLVDAPVACTVALTEAADVSLARTRARRLVRHTVFTARYRLTRKGADRGKWEFEVVADADAPLGTVDMVVRGVQRRAGDDEEPERLTAEGVRAALDGQAWQRTT